MVKVTVILSLGLVITVDLFKKFKEASKGYKYFSLEKNNLYKWSIRLLMFRSNGNNNGHTSPTSLLV